MNVGSFFQAVLVRYVLAQAVLLPPMLLSWFALPKRASLRFQWAFHRTLVVLAIALPLLFALPVASRIVHAFDDLALRPSATSPASAEIVVETTEEPMPLSPPPQPAALAPSDGSLPARPEVEVPADLPGLTLARALDLLPAVLAAFSGLGMLGFAAGIGLQSWRERRIRGAAGSTRRIGRVRVVIADSVRSPFSTGLLRPRIYLPTGIARSKRARRMVLAHESLHVRHAHIAWTFLERCHAALFWYNPLAHLAATNGARLRELVCDRDAGRILGDAAYCRVLLDAAASLVGERAAPGLANGWIGRRFLRRRIEFLSLGLGKTSRSWVFAATPVAALVSLAILISCGPRVLPEAAADEKQSSSQTAHSITTLTNLAGTWPGTTYSSRAGLWPSDGAAVVDTMTTGWNMGTGRLRNFWADEEKTRVLGVDNPDGFWIATDLAEGVTAAAFNEDVHTLISGLLLHLPFLQRIWAGLRASDPDLQGDTDLIVSVDSHGTVTSAAPDPDDPGTMKLAKAYATCMKAWKLTTRELASAYRMRVPISSYLRQNPPLDCRIMSVRLGDPIADVPSYQLTYADATTLGGQELWDAWYWIHGIDPDSAGTVLVAVTIAPDGSIRDSRVLDSDLAGAPRAADIARKVKAGPGLKPVPSGREIALVLLFSSVPNIADSGIRGWEYHQAAFAIGRDAVQYVDTLKGGVAGRVKLEIPSSGFTSITGRYKTEKSSVAK